MARSSAVRRDPAELAAREYDLVVVGGGIFGAAVVWEAASRGLSVALLERGDFGAATSANHFKVVHGGIRYLQHLDVARVRESSHERSTLLRIAPHLVYPLPIVMPAYGHGIRGQAVLRTGFALYDALTADRNRGIGDPDRRIPRTTALGREAVAAAFDGLPRAGLAGGAVFHDAQIYSAPRLVLAFLRSAVAAGAVAANYVEVTGFLCRGSRVTGVRARDVLDGAEYEVRARMVLNAAGPWAAQLTNRALGADRGGAEPVFSRDLAFVVRRRLPTGMGVAVSTGTRDADALLDRGGRHLFVLPWRDVTLVGVWHRVHTAPPDAVHATGAEVEAYLAEVDRAYPGLRLRPEDVLLVNYGLTLFGERDQRSDAHRFGKRSLLIDHAQEDGVEGLITLVGVRATVARAQAQSALDRVLRRLGRPAVPSRTATTPLVGGDVDRFGDLVRRVGADARLAGRPAAVATALAHNHGTRYDDVLRLGEREPRLLDCLPGTHVLAAEVVHAVREEAAVALDDVVLRRTDLGSAGFPGEAALTACARLTAAELDWSEARIADELDRTRAFFRARTPALRASLEPVPS